MKHLLEIIKENGYEPWQYSFTFPNQNANAKEQNRYILENKEKYNVIFIEGNEKKGSFYFKNRLNSTDFSTMRVGGLATFFVKDNDFDNPIIWGLQEAEKPPTLIKPKLKYITQDSFERVLKKYDHQFIFDNLYTDFYFEL